MIIHKKIAFSVTSESIFKELEIQLTHCDPLFRSDNAMLFSMLEEAIRSTIYLLTMKLLNWIKNGRAAYLALMNSHVGKENGFENRKRELHSLKWNGRQYSLEKLTNLHRSNFI